MKNIELDLQKITINEDRNKIIRDTLRENEVDVKKDIPTPKRWSFDDLKKTNKLTEGAGAGYWVTIPFEVDADTVIITGRKGNVAYFEADIKEGTNGEFEVDAYYWDTRNIDTDSYECDGGKVYGFYEYEEGDIDATDEETAEEIAKILKGEELIVKPLIGSGYVHSDIENPIVVEDEEGYNVVEASKESGNLEWYGVNITKVVLDASDLANRVNAAYDSYSDQEEDLEGIRGENLGESNIRESFDTESFDIETAILNTELASRFLGRWVSDCEYILGACQDAIKSFPDTNPKGALKHLWANDIDEQIRLMKKAKSTLDKAKIPTTVTYKDIDMYSKKLHELEDLKENKKPKRSGRRFNKSNEHPYIKMPSNTKNPDDWDWEHWDLWDETDKELFPPYDTDEDYDDYEIDELDGLEFDGHEVLLDGKAVGFTGGSGEAIFNAYSGCPSEVFDYFYDKGYTVRKPYSERKRKVVESKEDPTDEEQTKEFEPSDATIEPAGILKDMNKVADPCDKGNTDGVAHVDEDGHLKKVTESSYGSYDGWSQEDIDLHKSIDWDANHYRPYDAGDAFEDDVYYYGTNPEDTRVEKAEFHKFINANPIYPPYYAPVGQTKNDEKYTWSMYDGRKHGNYDKHDRRETYDLYTKLSN